MEIWKNRDQNGDGCLDRISQKVCQNYNLKVIDSIDENGKVAYILESVKNSRRFILVTRKYVFHPHGNVISGLNKKAVDIAANKNWTLIVGFEREDFVYELNANTIIQQYSSKTKNQHNQILYDDVSFKSINALNWNPSRRRTMNKPETFITNLFKNNNLPIIYTGDGRFPIASKMPDWVVIISNGRGKVIDFFGKYYHQGEDEDKNRKQYNKEGYDYLVIWEGEEQNPTKLLRKVRKFLGIEEIIVPSKILKGQTILNF